MFPRFEYLFHTEISLIGHDFWNRINCMSNGDVYLYAADIPVVRKRIIIYCKAHALPPMLRYVMLYNHKTRRSLTVEISMKISLVF